MFISTFNLSDGSQKVKHDFIFTGSQFILPQYSKLPTKLKQHKYIHIVAFDVPFPANYGGVIDIYFKIDQISKINW